MREYAKVSPAFWTGKTGKEIKRLGVDATVMAVYLMTSPHSNMLGLYYQPILYAAHETGLGIEGASKGLRCCVDAGLCHFDEASEMVWVVEMAAYQIGENLSKYDKRCKGVQREYLALPDNPFLPMFFDRYTHDFHLEIKRNEAPKPRDSEQAPCKPLASKEQEQEQEQEQEKGARTRKQKPKQEPVEGFESFWLAYPNKAAKKDAIKAFTAINPSGDTLKEILRAVERQRLTPKWTDRGGQFVPHAASWLRGERWNDEPDPDAKTADLYAGAV